MKNASESTPITRAWIARAFSLVEDVVYIGLAILLAVTAIILLVRCGTSLATMITTGTFAQQIIGLLDQILLILLVVELLYTVQVSFREHTIVAEPFLLVGIIAVIRRVLILTAQVDRMPHMTDVVFRQFATELGVLTILVLVLVVCFVLMRKRGTPTAERS